MLTKSVANETLERAFGTGFFISPNKILTAGYMVKGREAKIYATIPGLHSLHPQWEDNESFRCRTLAILPAKHAKTIDLAILDSGSYVSQQWLDLDFQTQDPFNGSVVHILGYAGRNSDQWLETYNYNGSTLLQTRLSVETLLPPYQLIVTEGKILSAGELPVYSIATVYGMGGGPVLVKGKLAGISTDEQLLT